MTIVIEHVTPELLFAKALELRALARQMRKAAESPPEKISDPFVDVVIDAVCRHYRIERLAVMSQCRSERVVMARHCAYYMAREICHLSFPETGLIFGRHHASIIHGCNKVLKRMARAPIFAAEMNKLMAQIAQAQSETLETREETTA